MSIVYLNGEYMPMEEAHISPMDRGFLFGDGIYEVVPSYAGKLVGFKPHLDRMQDGLDAIEIQLKVDQAQWREIADQLIAKNGGGNLGIYFHVSRGADSKRAHAYPENIDPTLFAFAFEIPPAPQPAKSDATPYTVSTAEDLRWKRCNIKSTALLGNVMHYQQGHAAGHSETLLYNQHGELTEAAACNVFVVKDGVIATPELDHQKLPGITRLMLLEILRKDGTLPVEERVVKLEELDTADEVWITSSSKEIAPVIAIEDKPVGDGEVGDMWLAAQTLYSAHKFDF
ncbi:cytochrome c551 [Halioglobus japonicus]|uniref:Aminodeoxychorismate lyase n=1 Tax=Halioglobus japonicus TaxID=930805 RepID=A0AAP8MGG6_9GAMM|nr:MULTISPECIES: aminotransferase class IV [Halioglobus]KZX60636.1 D-alanine aminotransferase [Halioglobus sp. HI00S01]PLW87428.1 D-alanine aminotransferase [Halioglobus japonicus]GHD08532.1 cytochrome c551 [Halioglobus japonicus]